jgi:hypothetical protein
MQGETQQQAPRGVAEQEAAVRDLLIEELGQGRREAKAQQPALEGEVPEQESLDESLVEGDDEAGSEATEADAQEEMTAEEIRSVTDFAKAAGWDPADFYGLTVNLDTGEEIPLGQVKDKLQEYGRQKAELAAQQQALAEEREALRMQAQQTMLGQQQLSEAALTARGQMEGIQARYNSVNWEALKETDPGRYAALQQDFAVEYAGAKASYQEAMQQQEAQRAQYWGRAVAAHNEAFLNAVPEWRDPKVVEKEVPEYIDFMVKVLGFRPEELEGIIDSRARVAGRMAWLWHKHQQKVAASTDKVRKAPKPVVRPGGGMVGQGSTSRERRIRELEQKAKTTRNRSDQEAAVAAILSSVR